MGSESISAITSIVMLEGDTRKEPKGKLKEPYFSPVKETGLFKGSEACIRSHKSFVELWETHLIIWI